MAFAAILALGTGGCGGGEPGRASSGGGPGGSGSTASASTTPSASPSPAASAPAESPTAAASTEAPATIALSGHGPLGMAVAGTRGWVVATDSGRLIELDLAAGKEVAAIDIGPGGSGVVVGDGGTIYVGRYDPSDGKGIVVVRDAGAVVDGIASGALGGLAAGERGTIWALEKAGSVLHVDPATGRVTGRVAVVVDANEHMEIVAGGGARWISSDSTPVRRIAADATIAATIETGGGIPLAFADGLVWGARATELWAIDPATNTVSKRIPLTDIDEILALDVATDGREAWIAARRPGRVGTVVRLALPGGRVVASYPVSLPAAVELGEERAWVTDYDTSEVVGFAR